MNILEETNTSQRDGRRDFDFLVGSWQVAHRRRQAPLSGPDEWYEFSGTCVASQFWNGLGNMDDNVMHMPQGRVAAISVRFYNQQTRQWSIYWATDKNGLAPIPTVGAFEDDGVGRFYDRETFEGQPIVVRYTWFVDGPDSLRWEQAFSTDDGATWLNNWMMVLARTA